MTIDQIEENIKKLFGSGISEEKFIFDFLLAYGLPKASVSRLKKGDYNLSKNYGEILCKKRIFFKPEKKKDLYETIDYFKNHNQIIQANPRFIIVTDFKKLLSIDKHTNDSLDISISDLSRHFDFFLPLAGMEKFQVQQKT